MWKVGGEQPMKQVTLDASLRSRLNGLSEELELLDEKGQTLGHFLPEALYKKMLYAAAEAACPYSKEELEQFRQETGGQPLANFWKTLGQT
jgi:hypothetical protein